MTNREALIGKWTRFNSAETARAIVRIGLRCEHCPAVRRCDSLKRFARMGEGINLSMSCEEIIQSWLEQEAGE